MPSSLHHPRQAPCDSAAQHREWPTEPMRTAMSLLLLIAASGEVSAAEKPAPLTPDQLATECRNIAEALERRGASIEVLSRQRALLHLFDAMLTKSTDENSAASSPSVSASEQQSMNASDRVAESPQTSTAGTGTAASQTGTPPSKEAALAPTTRPGPDRELLDAVWGPLPDRERDTLIRNFNERFLPGYEEQVRAYYEALARRRPAMPDRSSDENAR